MRVARSLSILSACLVAISGLAGHLSGAAAQAPEKRIALVVGNGAYAKSPLATAANDAGLIAPTLQAAGFDVIGARDLDGDTLRKSFRDFINQAEASGPGTVAPAEQGPYGAYAQSLAEMIRTGGLPLPEVFNRVRLRVNEASKGAQVPWDNQKVDAAFTFFERAPDAPAAAPPDQVAAAR